MNFLKPVFHGEIITAKVKITNIKPDKSVIFLDTICCNEKNENVIEGKAVVKLIELSI